MTKTDSSEALTSNGGEHDDTEYPPPRVVLPAMAAIWLAFFVVGLVSAVALRKYRPADNARRIEQSLVQLCLRSHRNSRVSET